MIKICLLASCTVTTTLKKWEVLLLGLFFVFFPLVY